MRITGGEYRGRILQSPKDRSIRPTSDKVRLAVFNILNTRGLVENAHVIDAFCGTGALGIEALSWGAASCAFIDKNKSSLDLARRNCDSLKIENPTSFLLKDASRLGPKPENTVATNLVFLDPPYNQGLIPQSLESLAAGGWVADGSHILIESETGLDPVSFGHEILMTRDYGDTRIALLRYAR